MRPDSFTVIKQPEFISGFEPDASVGTQVHHGPEILSFADTYHGHEGHSSGNATQEIQNQESTMENPYKKSNTEAAAPSDRYIIESKNRSLKNVSIPGSIKRKWKISISSTGEMVIQKNK